MSLQLRKPLKRASIIRMSPLLEQIFVPRSRSSYGDSTVQLNSNLGGSAKKVLKFTQSLTCNLQGDEVSILFINGGGEPTRKTQIITVIVIKSNAILTCSKKNNQRSLTCKDVWSVPLFLLFHVQNNQRCRGQHMSVDFSTRLKPSKCFEVHRNS